MTSRSNTRFRRRYRCNRGLEGCGRRFTLPRKTNEPRCPHCGADEVQDVERYVRATIARYRCDCSGFNFPHKKGMQPFCFFAEQLDDAEERAEEFEMQQRQQWRKNAIR